MQSAGCYATALLGEIFYGKDTVSYHSNWKPLRVEGFWIQAFPIFSINFIRFVQIIPRTRYGEKIAFWIYTFCFSYKRIERFLRRVINPDQAKISRQIWCVNLHLAAYIYAHVLVLLEKEALGDHSISGSKCYILRGLKTCCLLKLSSFALLYILFSNFLFKGAVFGTNRMGSK